MREKLIIITISAFFPILISMANNTDEYYAIGKTWIYEKITHGLSPRYFSSISVSDSIVDPNIFKKIECNYLDQDQDEEKWSYWACDMDGKIYHLFPEENASMLIPYEDYTLEEGDVAPYFNSETGTYEDFGMHVDKVENIMIKGRYRKVMTMKYPNGSFADYWIEGIGSVYSRYICGQPIHATITLLSCYLDGECLFDQDDIPLLSKLGTNIKLDDIVLDFHKIKYDAGSDIAIMSVFDMNGVLISKITGTGMLEIDKNSLNQGIYIVCVESIGSRCIRRKICM